jgi:hypothetical protein
MVHDKHARAYAVLLNDRSKRIEANLCKLPSVQEAHPEQDLLCLKCHAMDAQGAKEGRRIAFEDGVGCERCHGRAEAWIGEHFLRGWAQLSEAEKESRGFRSTKDLVSRGRLCAECHIGSAGQEVNHDLIAAGHPRLNFEYAAYLEIMPPHWSRRDEKARYPDLEERTWAIGQVLSAEQALKLLAYLANPTHGRPWPELAEYSCFACHHHLKDRQKQQVAGRRPGEVPWGTWYYSLLPQAVNSRPGEKDSHQVQTARDDLRKAMGTQTADRDQIARKAKAAAEYLGQTLAALEQTGTGDLLPPRQLFEAIAKDNQKGLDADWDSATQYYLALAALHQAMTDLDPPQRDPRWRKVLQVMAGTLRFPPGQDSPLHFDPSCFDKERKKLQTLLRPE